MADRHVAQGEQHIAAQEILLTTLQIQGHATGEAESLLKLLNQAQVEHLAHRHAIAEALEEAPRSSK